MREGGSPQLLELDPTPFECRRFAVVYWPNQRRFRVSGNRYSPEEIISKLREAKVYLAKGVTVGEVIRRLAVTTRRRALTRVAAGSTTAYSRFRTH